MTKTDAHDGIGDAQAEAPGASRAADTETLDRAAWIIYVVIFAVIPFAVAFFRTDMLAWHYYLAGAAFLGGALAICAMNLRQ